MQWTHLLNCPVCHAGLTDHQKMLTCTNKHTFDTAKEGYVNLLLKKLPGDTKEMLTARRTFLEHEHYRPLSSAINELVAANLEKTSSPLHILDAGCGEGYYLGRLQHYLAKLQPSVPSYYIGVDISKDAIKMAAKKYQKALFIVANLKERLTFSDATFDVILNIFAPRNADEFTRVIAPEGLLIVIIPGPTHLLQLRSTLHLLNIEENKQQHVIEQFAKQFQLVTSTPVTYDLLLQGEEIMQAVTMTPNYWHMSDETRKALGEITAIQTQVEFLCLVFKRKCLPTTEESKTRDSDQHF